MPTVELENTMLHGRRSSGPSEDRGMGGGDSGDEGKNDCVLYEMGNGIATLTLNRPEVKNAFSSEVYLKVAELLERAEKDESVVAVVLTGAGDYFTSGADVKELMTSEPPTTLMSQQPFGIFASTLLRFPKLVVAAVNGPAVGVGVTLLPHCDVVYAYGGTEAAASAPAPAGGSSRGQEVRVGLAGEKPADFWTPFFQLAIVPEFCSSVTLPAILGWSLANEMLVMGRKLTGAEALSSGLISQLTYAETAEVFLQQASLEPGRLTVKNDVERTVVDIFMAPESASTFKRIMWRNRRPMLLRVLEEEMVDLGRRVQAGHPKAALEHLARRARHPSSRL
ncbi:unnamed protein product [Ascophyllum nodosum]